LHRSAEKGSCPGSLPLFSLLAVPFVFVADPSISDPAVVKS
jgi:hypothetical protein